MKTIIAGTRGFNDYEYLVECMNSLNWRPTLIVSGTARGADKLGEKYAKDNNIPTQLFPANWNKYGKAAGPVTSRCLFPGDGPRVRSGFLTLPRNL